MDQEAHFKEDIELFAEAINAASITTDRSETSSL
jgi:hypothetical protein